ncbi:hypothetical protein BLA28_20610 [Eisenbergiella tayi]|uniref:L-arabinose transport system permease protein AraQ n=2 Tax=Eisenbergiella tayi TaxID=1432052 RepID=A0A1E3ARC7_9FIRM|nr:carbohydrate ABC transporter permease [Eisenbergiella tayi]ODM11283.1 L-arabinose transport system permease protein AraQ [Eisenbergiella tayi]OIZ62790.1 hypothetical protein BLA28_20610 [Eisenbergiella tayi]
MKRKRISHLFAFVLMLLIGLIMVFPLFWMVRSSVMTQSEIFRKPMQWLPERIQWKNYVDIMTLRPFARWICNSAFIVVFNVLGTMLTCSMAAFAFARLKFRGRNVVFSMVLAAMMIPSATLLIPQFMIWKILHGIDTYAPLILGAFGAPGFYTFMLRQFYKGIPMDIDEAAKIDGASPLRIYMNIIIPLSKAPLVTVAIFTFTNCWNDFMGPLIYLSSEKKYTAALGLRSFIGMYTGQWHYLMAASTVLVIPVIILFACCQKVFIGGINLSGGLKG